MKLCLNKQTALRIIRFMRKLPQGASLLQNRTQIAAPDCSPRRRWVRRTLDLSAYGYDYPLSSSTVVHVAVPSAESRLQASFAMSTVYQTGLPQGSFVSLERSDENDVRIACPELVFCELASTLPLAEAVMIGNELCGGFARDGKNPRGGDVTFDVAPVTSVEKIAAYLERTKHIRGLSRCRRALEFVSNNAWSPVESAVGVIASLPIEEFGYGLGKCIFNKRIEAPEELKKKGTKYSRVPDLLFEGERVGLNYDGGDHLDLESIVTAAVELATSPQTRTAEVELETALGSVRSKVVDDARRNRELAASGHVVFPVVKEDLYERGALDALMIQVIKAQEYFSGKDLSRQKAIVADSVAAEMRYQLAVSLLPGRGGEGVIWRDGEAELDGVAESFVEI